MTMAPAGIQEAKGCSTADARLADDADQSRWIPVIDGQRSR